MGLKDALSGMPGKLATAVKHGLFADDDSDASSSEVTSHEARAMTRRLMQTVRHRSLSRISRGARNRAWVFLATVVAVASWAFTAGAFASSASSSGVVFTVVRVPTNVTNKDLSIPGSARDNAFSPAQSDLTYCNWRDGIPGRPVLSRRSPSYPGISCKPLIAGRSFGLLQSPKNGHFEYEVLRVAHAARNNRAVSVGPVLATFGDGAGGRPSAAEANGWIWVYVPQQRHAEVLRFSSRTGVLTQKLSIPAMGEPIMAANDDGLFFGWSNQGSLHGAVYFLATGATRLRRLQTTKRFVFLMRARSDSVTAVEAPRAAGPFTAYRFTAVHK